MRTSSFARIISVVLFTSIFTFYHSYKEARANPGDIMVEIFASEVSWTEREYVGHAFFCISIQLNSGIKEDCYGFYPVGGSGIAQVLGAGVVGKEVERKPTRFARIGASVAKKITDEQRRQILRISSSWNGRLYQLTNSNCIDLVSDIAGLAGLQRPIRSAIQLPLDYVSELANLNRAS